mgnify:CR=1 FL=1
MGHVVAVPGVEFFARMAGEGGELEVQEFVDVQRARLVLLVELDVLRFLQLAVDDALADQKLRPLKVGVAGEQGVVEVEEGEVHGWGGWFAEKGRHYIGSLSRSVRSHGQPEKTAKIEITSAPK